jgi:hypothetical protein
LSSPSVELQKANLQAQNPAATGGLGPSTPGPSWSGVSSAAASPLASLISIAQLMAKPGALNVVTSLSALWRLTECLEGTGTLAPVQLSRPQMVAVRIRPILPGCGARAEVWAHRITARVSLRGASLPHTRTCLLSCVPKYGK